MSAPIPTLETDRLILRGLQNADLDRFAEMMADEDVIKFLGGIPLTKEESWRNMALFSGHWNFREFGQFAIQEKASGKFIGRVGPWMPEGWPALEIGWVLHRDSWGLGYATEAAAKSIDWIFTQKPSLNSVISIIDERNLGSQKVAERLGSQNSGDVFHYKGGEYPIWSLHRTVWNSRNS